MDSFPSRLLLNVVFIFIIALLRLAQVSVDSVSEARLNKMADSGNLKAQKALLKLEKSLRIYNCFKIIIVFAELLIASINTVSVHNMTIDKNLLVYEMPVTIACILFLAFVIQLFGIYIPQKIASKYAEKIMFSFSWLISLTYIICTPFERILSALTALILKPLGLKNSDKEDDEVTEEEIRFMVDVGSESGAIDPDEKEMIHNIFELNDTPIKDIMTHRTDVEFLWKEESIEVWEETINNTNHSIYPVCGENVDDIIGYIKTTDFYKMLRNSQDNKECDVSSIIRSPYLVPESIKADDLFRQMQKCKTHFAIVVDEYGGLGGIITMSDLLEEIVGDLDNDTEANEEEEIIQIDSNTWKILGSTDIDTVSEVLEIDLPIEEYNTFAGMILGELGSVPDDGSTAEVEAYGLQIKVTKISEHRIDEAIVCKIEQTTEKEE